nr:immunoglobulin light chain junction region [Macaca mulatta]MOV78038.1 immunoglobulin light chain junction region [Macaca mulatta]MOV78241.1 immunoglobulin light chain junction region [Macaca mulatta]MOV78348.1 immunoglobulin light chain junction region [Macaca mulatta]MOV78699.1 immunoglobulin light chain junction region [Macaca mulatta]
CQQYNSDLFTF